jgi:hypothetical protein
MNDVGCHHGENRGQGKVLDLLNHGSNDFPYHGEILSTDPSSNFFFYFFFFFPCAQVICCYATALPMHRIALLLAPGSSFVVGISTVEQ